jgi:hypothetical protein
MPGRILLEKLIIDQLVWKFFAVYRIRLSFSKEPTTEPQPVSFDPNPHHYILFHEFPY